MSDPFKLSDLNILRELRRRIGDRKLVLLAGLTLVASLSEGIGLFLLIPITHVIYGDSAVQLPDALDVLAAKGAGYLLIGMVVIVSLRALIVFLANELRRSIQLDLSHTFRTQAHEAIVHAEWRWLSRKDSSDHAALIVGESERSAALFGDATTIFNSFATITILGLVAMLALPSVTMAVAVVALPLFMFFVVLAARRAEEGNAYWAAYSQIQTLLSNGITKLRAARISGAQDILEDEFRQSSLTLSEIERSYFRRGHINQTAFQIVAVLALAGIVFVTLEIGIGSMALLIPVLVLAVRAIPLLNQTQQAWRSWRYNAPAFQRLMLELEEARSHRERSAHKGYPVELEQAIEVNAVDLSYDDRAVSVLSRISLTIERGEFVAIAGPSGTGKSSLADLLCGLLVPDHGEIRVDGTALGESNRMAWRERVSYLEQNPFFLSKSVRENLCWGLCDKDDAELRAALALASAAFVHDWPKGLDTMMGEGGRQLSGGELRRLALARALMRQPDLLILDEFTASIDKFHANAIIQAVQELKGKTTIVALTHDERVMAVADRVFSLERQK